jgi:probable rRNA maturation factor
MRHAVSLLALHGCEVSVLLADDAAVRRLNRSWRNQDRPTNVLSFPAHRGRADGAGPRFVGDIVIAYQTVEREASVEHKTFAQHLSHLAVHGFLHLLGYDHKTDSEATAMERLETMILARLNVPDPYRLPELAPAPDGHA